MVQGVADLWGRDAAGQDDRLVSPEQLRTQLARVSLHRSPLLNMATMPIAIAASLLGLGTASMAVVLLQVREKRAVAVLLVDLMDASGSFLPRVRELVGRNPVVLVGTKVDPILPLSDCMFRGAISPW